MMKVSLLSVRQTLSVLCCTVFLAARGFSVDAASRSGAYHRLGVGGQGEGEGEGASELRAVKEWASKLEKDDLHTKDTFTFAFSRSSGPGGQNVNKVNTKADLRFDLARALWIPHYVRRRLLEAEGSRLTKAGEFVIVSERFRTQKQNLDDCFAKLHKMLLSAAETPGETSRETRARVYGHQLKEKEERIKEKRERQATKSQRRHKGQHDHDD